MSYLCSLKGQCTRTSIKCLTSYMCAEPFVPVFHQITSDSFLTSTLALSFTPAWPLSSFTVTLIIWYFCPWTVSGSPVTEDQGVHLYQGSCQGAFTQDCSNLIWWHTRKMQNNFFIKNKILFSSASLLKRCW